MQMQISLMLGNLYSAGELKVKRETISTKVRVNPWFVAHAKDVVHCANYYVS